MPSRSLSAVKSYSLSGSTGKSTDFKGLTLPRAEHSAPLERRKYLAFLWSNSCCFLFIAALIALGTGETNCPGTTAEVVLRCSEWVEGIKRFTPMVALVALPRFQSSTNTIFTWLTKAKCEQAFTDEEEVQNLPQTPSALYPQTVL